MLPPDAPAAPPASDVPLDPHAHVDPDIPPNSGIERDGDGYLFHGYRYDRLADAQAYAALMRQKSWLQLEHGPHRARPAPPPLTAQELTRMAALGITQRAGQYHYAGYRYDRLADAMAYAETRQGISRPEGPAE